MRGVCLGFGIGVASVRSSSFCLRLPTNFFGLSATSVEVVNFEVLATGKSFKVLCFGEADRERCFGVDEAELSLRLYLKECASVTTASSSRSGFVQESFASAFLERDLRC